jgi:Outer membrane protein beta-barrel domain
MVLAGPSNREPQTIMTHQIVLFVCAVTVFVPTILHADEFEESGRRMGVGAHLGLAFGNIHGNFYDAPGQEISYRTGFTAGGAFAVRLTEIISAQVGLDFVSKGNRVDTGFPTTSFTSAFNYFEIPVLGRIHVPLTGSVDPYAYAGPVPGILLDADGWRFDGVRIDFTDRTKRLDIGLMAGLGAAFDIDAIGAFTLDLRYNHGLLVRNKNATSDNEIMNRAIYLTVGYRADLATLGRLFGRGSRPRGPAEPVAPGTAPESSAASRR